MYQNNTIVLERNVKNNVNLRFKYNLFKDRLQPTYYLRKMSYYLYYII